MKKFIFVLMVAILTSVSDMNAANGAESGNTADKDSGDPSSGGQIVIKSEQKSAFKGFLYKFWGKLRAISPSASANKEHRSVATAGVRGAETTTSVISPYWKDDNSEDPEYIKELEEFSKAQQLAEEGDLEGAVTALSSFINEYSNSDYRANAQFALGMSYGGLGKNAESVSAFQDFVNDNPKHPLVDDAKKVMAQLR